MNCNLHNKYCFIFLLPLSFVLKGADSRIASHPQLQLLHTLFLREHNRIAKSLSELNAHWDDERLYQEAKRILIAQIQHITYNEWLPIIVGR